MSEGGATVRVAKSDPPSNFIEIGPVTAVDGEGCGGFGYRGTYNRAVIMLKNQTYEMGGVYVQVMTLTEPHPEPGCFDNTYRVSGTAFRQSSVAHPPVFRKDVGTKSSAEKLLELKKLLRDKIITQEEFDQQEARIMLLGH